MTTKMTRETFEAIITQDLQWLLAQEETPARRHIETIVKDAANHYYPRVDAPGLIVLKALARHFDQRHAEKTSLADELREADSASYPEHQAIAATYADAADVVWNVCGGRPGEQATPIRVVHTVNIDAVELGKLIDLATIPAPEQLELVHSLEMNSLEEWQHCTECVSPSSAGALIEGLRARIAELESRTPANEVSNAERLQYDTTIEQQRKRIAELEAQRDYQMKRAAYATAKLAIQLMPIVLDGKTPGEVSMNARDAEINSRHPGIVCRAWHHLNADEKQYEEAGAQAVLRAFGLAMEARAVREALERVRERIQSGTKANHLVPNVVDNLYWGSDVVRAINAEIEDLESAPAVDSHNVSKRATANSRIFLGITFERGLPDGSRENVDPSKVRIVVEGDSTQLVPVAVGTQS